MIDTDKIDQERAERELDGMIRYFLKRYEPEERRDRLDFEADLHRIVREIYREASKPYEKALMGASLLNMTQAPVFIPKGDK